MSIDRATFTARFDQAARKRAELAGSVGALVLGVGLGALGGVPLRGAALPLVVAGGMLHAVGMWTKHRAERAAAVSEPWWVVSLYWTCWIALGALALGIGLRWPR